MGSASLGSSIIGEFVPSLSSDANDMGSLWSVPVSLMPVSMRTSPPLAFEYVVRVRVWVRVGSLPEQRVWPQGLGLGLCLAYFEL